MKKFSNKTITLAAQINKEEFEAFYKLHSAVIVQQKYNIGYQTLLNLLKYFNIKQHTKEEAYKLKNTIKNIPKYALTISKDNLEQYYTNHSITETCIYFNISYEALKSLIKYYNIIKTEEQIAKTKKEGNIRTCLARYGTTNGGCSPEALKKIKQTNKQRYGSEYYYRTDDFKQKANKTKLERYGRANIGQFGTIEHEQAMLSTYGVATPMESEEIKQHLDDSMIKRYGVNRYAKTLEFHKKARKLYIYDTEKFDSSWELALWIYAKDHNEEIIRCPCKFEYIFENKIHEYFPDFLYNNKLIEIKGDNYFDKNGNFISEKNKAKYEYCIKNNNILIWKFKNIKFALDYCKNKFNNKYRYRQFNTRRNINGEEN